MKKKAFTLIELLIVIAIIGVLAAALYPTIRDALSRGRDAAREGDINNIVTAVETFNSDYGTYPDADDCIGSGNVFLDPADGSTDVTTDYFKGGKAPEDPSPNRTVDAADDIGTTGCVSAGQYYYKYIGDGGIEFVIGTIMETEKKNNSSLNPDTFTGTEDYTVAPYTHYMRVL